MNSSIQYTIAGFLNISRLRFFVASVAVHVLMLSLFYPARPIRVAVPETIPVSLVNPREPQPSTAPTPHPAPARPRRSPGIAPKPSLRPLTNPAPARRRIPEKSPSDDEAPRPTPPPSDPIRAPRQTQTLPEPSVVTERSLPSLKELLPPANYAAATQANAPVSLSTRDPVYVSYFNKIKQLIESHWNYPELALRYGLQGKLSLEFTIGASGQLERLRLVRSSGSQLLDDEALRAIKAAAPFPAIPPWIKSNPLSISASMEYLDNRRNYRFTR